jgi:hypothetical protein
MLEVVYDDTLNQWFNILFHNLLVQGMYQVKVHSRDIAEIKIDTDIKTVIDDNPVTLDHFSKTDVEHTLNASQLIRSGQQPPPVPLIARFLQPEKNRMYNTLVTEFSKGRIAD